MAWELSDVFRARIYDIHDAWVGALPTINVAGTSQESVAPDSEIHGMRLTLSVISLCIKLLWANSKAATPRR